MKNITYKGIGMTNFFKLVVTGTMVLAATTVMGAKPQVLDQLGISGSEPGHIRTACYIYNADQELVDGVVLDAYNEPFIDGDGNSKNLAVIKCALPKPPKEPRHGKPTTIEDQILLDYVNMGSTMMCLSPQTIIEKIDEVKDDEGNIITEEEDAVLTDYATTDVWQNIVSASGEISLVCKHITPAVDTAPPVLTLLPFCNDINYTIDKNRQYEIADYLDPGATAQDDLDGDITANIIVTGAPSDTSTVGDYTLTYSITDSSSNTVTATRVIRVVESTIKVTGQTTSYDNTGSPSVDDCSLKDDGFYQSGLPTQFDRDHNLESVTDQVTGLIWEDGIHVTDNDPKTKDPVQYCLDLNLNGITGWRLPDVWELLTIVDKRQYDSAIDPVFENVFKPANGYTRTITPDVLSGREWMVSFLWGLDVDAVDIDNDNYGVRCVKGNKLPNPATAYQKDSNTKIVSNGTTGLEWVDNDTTGGETKTWKEAIDVCENLSTGGYTDWRLPNINEYYSIFDYENNEIGTPFNLTPSTTIRMWSSTSSATGSLAGQSPDRAWVMKQSRGESSPKLKSDSDKYFMCVRNK